MSSYPPFNLAYPRTELRRRLVEAVLAGAKTSTSGLFEEYERESRRLIEQGLVLPAYDYCLKCSHTFNILDARGAIRVTERTHYIGRVRALARRVAEAYLKQREEMGHPLLRSQQ